MFPRLYEHRKIFIPKAGGAKSADLGGISSEFVQATDQVHERMSFEVRERTIKVVKPSTISTGQLSGFHRVHLRPINLVVYQGSLDPKIMESLS